MRLKRLFEQSFQLEQKNSIAMKKINGMFSFLSILELEIVRDAVKSIENDDSVMSSGDSDVRDGSVSKRGGSGDRGGFVDDREVDEGGRGSGCEGNKGGSIGMYRDLGWFMVCIRVHT